MPLVSSLTTHPSDRHVFLGDSTTNGDATSSWWAGTGFFGDQLQAQATALPANIRPARTVGTSSARLASASASSARQGTRSPPFTLLNSGVNGQTTAGIIASFSSLVTAKVPNIVWLTVGINDVITSVPLGPGANTFINNYTTILANINAALPGCGIVCTQILTHGEAWNTGPVWNNGADDATIDSFNAAIATMAAAATANCVVVNFRTLALAWEVTNNPAKDATGHLTNDGIHPQDTGRTQFAAWALPAVTVAGF